ncbi:MAG: hypothetical protein HKP48_07435 [Winogradskyella sp.]|uniref:hypothetical protein n=1 Tax=Winogradskyella sp. TaxID=1883156 RepID=UPI0017BD93A3|nr:hypothetical protein [Winogradskyella sp.]MBT8244314.1 hypothetical protein [Winogradskyella sp.]NNK23114.1 hypothetical protein [Winogradskyella sp.]
MGFSGIIYDTARTSWRKQKKSLLYANELEALSKVDGYLVKGYIYKYDDKPELAEKYYKLALKIGGSITCYETRMLNILSPKGMINSEQHVSLKKQYI